MITSCVRSTISNATLLVKATDHDWQEQIERVLSRDTGSFDRNNTVRGSVQVPGPVPEAGSGGGGGCVPGEGRNAEQRSHALSCPPQSKVVNLSASSPSGRGFNTGLR